LYSINPERFSQSRPQEDVVESIPGMHEMINVGKQNSQNMSQSLVA